MIPRRFRSRRGRRRIHRRRAPRPPVVYAPPAAASRSPPAAAPGDADVVHAPPPAAASASPGASRSRRRRLQFVRPLEFGASGLLFIAEGASRDAFFAVCDPEKPDPERRVSRPSALDAWVDVWGITPLLQENVDYSRNLRLAVSLGNTCVVYSCGSQDWELLAGHTARVTTSTFNPRHELLATGSLDGTVGLWRVPNTSKPFRVALLKSEGDAVPSSGVIPVRHGGKKFPNWVVAGHQDGTVSVWDVSSLKKIRTMQVGQQLLQYDLKTHPWASKKTIRGVEMSPDGKMVLVAGESGRVCLFSTSDNSTIRDLSLPVPVESTFWPGGGRGCQFVLVGSRGMSVWDTRHLDEAVVSWAGRKHSKAAYGACEVNSTCFATSSLDSSAKIWGYDGSMKQEWREGESLGLCHVPPPKVSASSSKVASSQSQSQLMGERDGLLFSTDNLAIRVYDVDEPDDALTVVHHVMVSANAIATVKHVRNDVVAFITGNIIATFDLVEGRPKHVWKGQGVRRRYGCGVFYSKSSLFYAGTLGGVTVKKITSPDYECVDAAHFPTRGQVSFLRNIEDISADRLLGCEKVAGGRRTNTIVWDLRSEKVVGSAHLDTMYHRSDADLSPDGKILALHKSRTTHLYDAKTFESMSVELNVGEYGSSAFFARLNSIPYYVAVGGHMFIYDIRNPSVPVVTWEDMAYGENAEIDSDRFAVSCQSRITVFNYKGKALRKFDHGAGSLQYVASDGALSRRLGTTEDAAERHGFAISLGEPVESSVFAEARLVGAEIRVFASCLVKLPSFGGD